MPQERAAQVALVQRAAKTSLILPLGDEDAPLAPNFAAMLFDKSFGVRLLALASSPDVARRALSDGYRLVVLIEAIVTNRTFNAR